MIPIEEKFEKINKDRPKYFILSYDNGWIDLESKDELSQEDWKNINKDLYAKLTQEILR